MDENITLTADEMEDPPVVDTSSNPAVPFKILKGEKKDFNNLQYNEGTMYYCTDTGELFIAQKKNAQTQIKEIGRVGKDFAINSDGTFTASNDFFANHGEIFNDYINNRASGAYSHAEGGGTKASGSFSHAEGSGAEASGNYSHAEGLSTKATTRSINVIGEYNHYKSEQAGIVEQIGNSTSKKYNINSRVWVIDSNLIEFSGTKYKIKKTSPKYVDLLQPGELFVDNNLSTATTIYEFVKSSETYQGNNLTGYQVYRKAHTLKDWSQYKGDYVHIVGNGTSNSSRSNAHTLDWEGNAWFAGDVYVGGTGQDDANAVKLQREITGIKDKKIVGFNEEGFIAAQDAIGRAGTGSGAEVFNGYATNEASGNYSHAEGIGTTASGSYSHAEGMGTTASGFGSHTEGMSTIASSNYSHAEGYGTTANSKSQHVQGEFNILDTEKKTSRGTYAHIVGNGTSNTNRKNAHTLDWEGNAWFAGDVFVRSAGGKEKDGGSKKLATEEFATNAANTVKQELQEVLDNKQNKGNYLVTDSSNVQCVTGGLVIGKSTTTGISGTGTGRIMFTGQSNPSIGIQAIAADGTTKTPYYFQAIAGDDSFCIGPTSTMALKFDNNGNMTSPANLSVGGSISEGGTLLSNKYATKIEVSNLIHIGNDEPNPRNGAVLWVDKDSGLKYWDATANNNAGGWVLVPVAFM